MQIFQREHAGQMQQRVQQRAAVTVGHDEAIAIDLGQTKLELALRSRWTTHKLQIGRIEVDKTAPQHMSDRRHADWHARMP